MMPGARLLRTYALFSCLFVFACSKSSGSGNATADAGPIPSGAGVGESCANGVTCRAGLACNATSKTCAPSGSMIQGGSCILSAECIAGNYCTQQGSCAASGTLTAGAVCSSEGDCASGLACAQTGLTGVCQTPGTMDVGHSCVQTADCMAGLICVGGLCSKGNLGAWTGLVCSSPASTTAKVLFHVPRAADATTNMDFYRLPFPNDIRMKNGKVSLTGHPRPGARVLPFDLVDRYITAIESEVTGFGANTSMYFRLSRDFNITSIGDCASTLVDITPTSPTYAQSFRISCEGGNGNSTYICGPYVAVRPALGTPLSPGTTYALLVKKTIVDLLGSTSFGADDDFSAMLAATPPTDTELTAAYQAYLPLRNYIAAGNAAAADLAAALVFTVQNHEDPLAGIDTAVAATTAPVVSGLVHCGDAGVTSPCDDALTGTAHTRGCLAADSAGAHFDTYQGTISLPVLQKGTVPYLSPSDGGNIVYDATGAATVQGAAKVCFSLSVPKGTAPTAGWPLVVYAHGTGGSYRSFVDLGLADDYAVGAAPAGLGIGVDGGASATPVPMAVLSYDGVMHGTRNGGSTKPVGELVYNFLNPAAARDNALQAAADLLAIPKALPSFASAGLLLDASRMSLYGHSQGGNAASLVGARQSAYASIVMSGTGGTLVPTLLGKTKPINIPAVLPYLLGEAGPAAVDANHPVLNLMQLYFERADSVNFGRRLFVEPLASMTAHHVLHVYGTGDSYSVVATQQAYALAAGFKAGAPIVDSFGLLTDASGPPYSANTFFGSYGKLTALEIQYQPATGHDGHFVSTENANARAAIQEMLVTTARDGVPTVTP